MQRAGRCLARRSARSAGVADALGFSGRIAAGRPDQRGRSGNDGRSRKDRRVARFRRRRSELRLPRATPARSRRSGDLLADPPSVGRIVAAVVRAVSIPVSLKIRSGPDDAHETAVEVSCQAEASGAAAVSVHARSVAQGYVGEADWSVIAGEGGGADSRPRRRQRPRGGRRGSDVARNRRGRRRHRARLPRQPVDFRAGTLALERRGRNRRSRRFGSGFAQC